MTPSATDKFTKVGNPGSATTLSAPGYTAGVSTSIQVGSTTNWNTETKQIFAIDRAQVVNGKEERIAGTYCEFEGIVSGANTITDVVKRIGTTQNYPAGSLTRVYIPVAATRENDLIDGLAKEHKLDGTHAAVTADSVKTPSLEVAGQDYQAARKEFPANFANFVESGAVWAITTGLNANMTAGVLWYLGVRYTLAAKAARGFTASKDTYVDIKSDGTVTYPEVANGAAAPAVTAASVRIAKVVTNGSAVTGVTLLGRQPVTSDKIDFTTFLKPKQVVASNAGLAQPGTFLTTTYDFVEGVTYLLMFNVQQRSYNNTGSVWQWDIQTSSITRTTSRSEGNGQNPQPIIGLYTAPATATETVRVVGSRLTGGAAVDLEQPRLMIIPLLGAAA